MQVKILLAWNISATPAADPTDKRLPLPPTPAVSVTSNH
jgi:hypothetical protein